MIPGEEAPMSTSSVVYYRGVAVTITKRDPEIEIKPLIEQQFKLIDWALNEKKALPSWNMETNKELKNHGNTSWQDEGESLKCKECDNPATLKTGISKKTGKPWKGIFCTTVKEHVQWVR
jgi:hypothetical protein